MRNVPYTQSSSRVVSAKAISRRARLVFSDHIAVESVPINNMDGDDSDGINFVAYSNGSIRTYFHAPDYSGTHDWGFVANVAVKSRPGICGKVIFYADGLALYKRLLGSYTDNFATLAGSYHSFAPINEDEVYVMTTVSDSGKSNRYAEIRYYYKSGGSWHNKQFHGVINGVEDGPVRIDALRVGGTDYIYFNDSNGKRAMYIKRVGDWWSDVLPVLPLDIVDDASKFVLTSAKMVNGNAVITGLLSRAYHPLSMHVYLIGPEEFTVGRDMFIKQHADTNGILLASGNTLYYTGNGHYSVCDASGFLGIATQTVSDGVVSMQMSASSNQPFSLDMDITTATVPNIAAGDELDAYAIINGVEAKLGVFGVDAIFTETTQDGKSSKVSARSNAMKKLSMWESDAPYDIWSQTKLSTVVSDLTNVVRTSGKWTKEEVEGGDDIYRLNQVNENGFLYATAKSARNGICKAKFTRPAAQASSFEAGVGLNYYQVVKEIDGEDTVCHSGVFAIVTGSAFELRFLRDNVWTTLSTTAYTPGLEFSLMVTFHEGLISGYYRSGSSWSKVLETRFVSLDYTPWAQNEEGRGAIYMRNLTPNSTSYPFMSTDNYIPVANNSSFPSSGTVLVDDEQIEYSGKSANSTSPELSFAFGEDVYRQDNITGTWQSFSDIRSRNYIIQKFNVASPMYVRGVEVYVKKVGSPEDGMVAMLCKGPVEALSPLGETIATATIYSDNISEDGGWIFFDFGKKVLVSGDNWLVLTRGHDAAHPNAVNYYATPLYNNGTNKFYTFNDDTDAWTLLPNLSLPMIVYGQVDEPGGAYRIYVNGALVNGTDYTNCALLVKGAVGNGATYRITGWQYNTGKPHILFLERNPTSAEKSSKLYIYPTLLASTRGANDTTATAHSNSLASIYYQPPYNGVSLLQYYSCEEDYSLEDMVRIIARKAGVLSVIGNKLFDGTITDPLDGTGYILRKNFIITLPSLSAVDRIVVWIGDEDYFLRIDNVNGLLNYNNEEIVSTGALIGRVKVSYYENTFSVWLNGRIVMSFYTPTPQDYKFKVTFVNDPADANTPVDIDIPEACMRVDNFILDEGATGAALIQKVIGDKRFFYQDTNTGNLRLFRSRDVINTEGTPHLSVFSHTGVDNDNTISRLLVQGAECYEVIDYGQLRNRGNIFHLSNMYEVYDLYDAQYFGELTMVDTVMRRIGVEVSGSGDPRVEPNDRIYAKTQTSSDGIPIVVEAIGYTFLVSEEEAEFSMNITGFEYEG